MRLWILMHRSINRNLYRFLSAQQKAEQKKQQTFLCPACGGEVHWGRTDRNSRMVCRCKGCGMYLRG